MIQYKNSALTQINYIRDRKKNIFINYERL